MTQRPGSISHPIALDYENTLVLAIELSNASWIAPRTEALLAAIDGYRDRSRAAGRRIERVVAIYEAGWSGFWLARWLARHGVETHIVQPSSVPVDRRARRAKSDGIERILQRFSPADAWEYARTFDLISGQADEQPLGASDSGRVYRSVPCRSSIANSVEMATRSPRARGGYRRPCRNAGRSSRCGRACWQAPPRACFGAAAGMPSSTMHRS